MPQSERPPKSFGAEGDQYLADFYTRFGAATAQQKMNALLTELHGSPLFYAMGGEVTEDMKLACLEYDFLDKSGKIKLVLA
jgi:hypothetical protein